MCLLMLQAMTLFLLRLRQLMQGSNISAFITFPAYLFSDQTVTRKVIWQADACIELESFAGTSLRDYPEDVFL